jgi:hypothetical protein
MERKMLKCKNCNKKISGRGKSCLCQSCVAKRRYKNHPENNPMFGKKLTEKHKKSISKANFKKGLPKCERCNKILSTYHNQRCWNCELEKRKIPENNGRWLGGISQHPYTYKFNKILKEKIRKRDNYKCQLCNKKQKEEIKEMNRALTVHHIDYCKINCKERNLITLCHKCNTKVNVNRDYWYSYFITILAWLKSGKK